MKECRVVLMGCGGVGKSALAIRFATGEFVHTYDPTIEDFYRHQVEVSGVGLVSLEILDTAGTGQHYTNNRHLYITSGHVFGLIYSVDSRQSLDNLQELYRDIVRVRRTSSLPIVLVGNKCDVARGEREVAVEDVRLAVRKTWGVSSRHCPLVIETSAKDGLNIEELFKHMARISAMPANATAAAAYSRTLPRQPTNGMLGSPSGGRKARSLPRDGLTLSNGGGRLAATSRRDSTIVSPLNQRYSQASMARPARSSWSDRGCTIL